MSLKEFFLITLPGLEELAQREVLEWFPEAKTQVEHGGVGLSLPFEDGLSLNLVLKIPTRILVRVERFKCRDFPKLYQKVLKLNWKEWLKRDVMWDVSVSSHGSRLSIKKRIKETCEAALEKRFPEDKSLPALSLYVRFVNDICTLSLDTSAHLLYKRTGEKRVGVAPLRETIGAAMIQWLGHYAVDNSVEVVDPMMGSGTILMEAGFRNTPTPDEHFNFEVFNVGKVMAPTLKSTRTKIIKLIGIEADKKTVEAARSNFNQAKEHIPLEIQEANIFRMNPLEPLGKNRKRWVVCNPPYGKRIKIDKPLKNYYENLFFAIAEKISPDWVCILIPKRGVKGKLKLPDGWKVREKLGFSNGGFPVTAYIFSCQLSNNKAKTPDSHQIL